MFACHAFGVFFVLRGRTWGKKLRSHLSLLWAPALWVRGSCRVRFHKRSVFGESRSLGGEANLFCAGALVWAFLGNKEGKAGVLVVWVWMWQNMLRRRQCCSMAGIEQRQQKRPAWPHRPVCGTLSQNGYGEGWQHLCDLNANCW